MCQGKLLKPPPLALCLLSQEQLTDKIVLTLGILIDECLDKRKKTKSKINICIKSIT